MQRHPRRQLATWIWLLALAPAAAPAQIFVYPRHADKSQVRYYEFNWQHVDILVGPQASKKLADPRTLTTLPTHEEAVDKSTNLGGPAQPFTEGPAQGQPRTEHLPPATPTAPAPDGGMPRDGGMGGTGGSADAGGVAPSPDAGALAQADAGVNPWYVWPPGLDAGTAIGGSIGPRSGGVRLFFYEREHVVAERAAAIIVDAYRELVTRFQFVPTQTFPYVLYSSYQEFLETTLFPLQEGILGITSTQGDLKLTLPYFGDHSLFADVSLHEMSHQFTIQKVRFLTEQAKVTGDPLESMPLWFVEGLAEFYAKHGIDPEADLLIRDLVVNPDAEMGYALIDFWEDRPFSVLWTYQAGQIRCAFLEDTYGAGFIQRVLDESLALVGSGNFRRSAVDFKGLIEKLTGDNAQSVSKKFESWLKRRAFRAYLSSEQDVTALELYPDAFALATSLASSPDGQVVLYRSFDEDTGRSRLVLVDPHDPSKARVVITDGVPGAESLHAVFGRNFDVGKEDLIFVAEVHGRDVIYRQHYSHESTKREPNPALAQPGTPMRPPGLGPTPPRAPAEPGEGGPNPQKEFWDVDLDLGGRVEYALAEKGLVGAFSPTLSPDGKRIAFIGLDERGVRDLYILEPRGDGNDFELTRLTNDPYSERQVSWGPAGIVYTSEATATGHFNLFKIVPGKAGVERLTNEARDEQDPTALPDGRVLFVSYDQGRADVHEVIGDQNIQRTQLSTGVFDLSPAPDGGLWVLFHYRGRRQPAQLKRGQLLSVASTTQPPAAPAYEVETASLLKAQKYRLFALENWELDPPFGFIGAGQGQVVGQIFAQAADRLRNHGVILYANIFGRLDLTNGVLLYQNQAHRVNWGGGLFQSLAFRFDTTFPELQNAFFTGERFWGGVVNARYPFDPFVYVEGELAAGGVNYFLDDLTRLLLATPEFNGSGQDLLGRWERLNGGTRLQTELTGRIGYDTLRWNPETGPIGGNSVLLELSGAVQPVQGETFGSARLDAEQYFPIVGRTHIFLRGGLGMAFGGRLAPQFFLSSFDTIRGVNFGDQRWLLGRDFLFTTAELQLPLNAILRLILLSDVEAIAGMDFGGVGDLGNYSGKAFGDFVSKKLVLDAVVGVNFSLGPLIFRLHFARPIRMGTIPLPVLKEGDWVTNFSLGIVGMPGFTDRARGSPSRRFPFTSPLMFR